jgi:hypothetical protein
VPGAAHFRWPGSTLQLPPGTRVLLYTDGLLDAYATEASAASLGIEELVAVVDKCIAQGEDAEVWLPQLVSRAPRAPIDDTAAVVLTLADGR